MLDKEKYQSWVNHPLTQEFHQYLKDYRADLMERWAQGQLSGNDDLMAVARAQMAGEIVNLADDAISEFYNERKENVPDN